MNAPGQNPVRLLLEISIAGEFAQLPLDIAWSRGIHVRRTAHAGRERENSQCPIDVACLVLFGTLADQRRGLVLQGQGTLDLPRDEEGRCRD